MSFYSADAKLQTLAQEVLERTWQSFPQLARNQIALTWLVYDPPVVVNTGGALTPEEFWQHKIRGYGYRGVERIYPASLVKVFYLVALQEWLQGGMINSNDELERAQRDMIVDSSNDATSYIVDVLTGTSSGPVLAEGPLRAWLQQRNIVNRYYQSLGWTEFESININQKTWGDGPYGRERQSYGEMWENRNMLTTDAIARLLHSVIGGVAVSPKACQSMTQLLQRSLTDIEPPAPGEENQVTGFLGQALPADSQIWSKAGWTSQVRHDLAYIEVPDKSPYLLAIFTTSPAYACDRELLPFISQEILAAMDQV